MSTCIWVIVKHWIGPFVSSSLVFVVIIVSLPDKEKNSLKKCMVIIELHPFFILLANHFFFFFLGDNASKEAS